MNNIENNKKPTEKDAAFTVKSGLHMPAETPGRKAAKTLMSEAKKGTARRRGQMRGRN